MPPPQSAGPLANRLLLQVRCDVGNVLVDLDTEINGLSGGRRDVRSVETLGDDGGRVPARCALYTPYDRWHDADGTSIPQQCRIEQIGVHRDHGALPSRLHKQGQVLGRGINRLNVQFDHENTVISIRPHLVRVVTTPDGC